VGVASIGVGILAVLLSFVARLWWATLPVAVLALSLGLAARKRALANNQPPFPATAGLALGVIAPVFALLLTLVWAPLQATTDRAFAGMRHEHGPVPLDRAHAVKVTAQDLVRDYLRDEKAAEKRYAGRTLEITGIVGEVTASESEGTSVEFLAGTETPKPSQGPTCYVTRADSERAANLDAGQIATFYGRFPGLNVVFWQLEGCELK
jgi:hypothetical protein